MSTLLLDASAILAAFDADDPWHEPATAILSDPSNTLATLDLVRYEVANVAVRAWRDPSKVAPLLATIDRISEDGGITLSTTTLLAHATEIAERHRLSIYDAAYVAAASQAGATLVSCDIRDLIDKGLASSPADMSAPTASDSQDF